RPGGLASRGQPGAGGHQQSRTPGLSEPTDQNARKGRDKISEAHARLRAALDSRWHRDDFGPDDWAGNGRYWPLSDGGQLCLVLSLCQKYENQQREAERPGQRQKWQPVSRVGLYGGSAVCHPLQPDGAAVLPTETRQKPSGWWLARRWPINCRGRAMTSCETLYPLMSIKLLAEVEPAVGLGLETGRKNG